MTTTDSMTWLTPESAEWETTWKRLYEALDTMKMSRERHAGESWQYMGSSPHSHTFRHRREKSTNQRVYAYVPTLSGPVQIKVSQPATAPQALEALPLVHLDRNSSPAGETCPRCGRATADCNQDSGL